MIKRYIILSLISLCALTLWASGAARIGTRSYSAQELQEGFDAYLQYQNRSNLSMAESQALFAQYFDELIGMYVYNQAIAEGMVKVSESELERYIMENVPDGIRAIQDFYTNGSFDLQKYQKGLRDNPDFKKSVLDFSREVYGYRKLVQKIRSEAVIDSQKVKTEWMQTGNSADAEIIYFNYNLLSEIETSEEDARRLYEENKQDYRREHGRSLRYVAFRGINSREHAGNKAEFERISAVLHDMATRAGLVNAASALGYELAETPFFSREDDVIRGIGKDAGLVAQAFQNKPGSLLEVYYSPFGDIFVIEVGREVAEYYVPFEVEQQILQLAARSRKRREANRELVQQFVRTNKSPSYLQEAEKAGIPIIAAKAVRLDSNIPGIGMIDALNRAILSTQPQEFSPLVEQDGFYYLARVQNRSIRTERVWQVQREDILAQALQDEQTRHLDEWYRARRAKLEIVYPDGLGR